jgi:hypothetical protein
MTRPLPLGMVMMRGAVDCFAAATSKNKKVATLRSSSTSMAILSVPPVGDDAFFLSSSSLDLPFFISSFPRLFPFNYPLFVLLFCFLIAFPASVLGMYFLGDGMDRDRFGGFGHDLALLLKFPLRFRVISQFPLISPSDLSPHMFDPFPPYFHVSSPRKDCVCTYFVSYGLDLFPFFMFSFFFP